MEEFATKLNDALVSYGYDPEVVNTWFETAGQNWEDLAREQDKANAALAQQQVREASDYAKGILDNAVADLRAQHEVNQQQMESELDAKVAEFKAQVDSAAQRDMDALEQFIADRYAAAQGFADADTDAMIDEQYGIVSDDAAVMLAQAAAAEGSSYGYAYGVAAAGVVGVAAYLVSKKQEKAVSNEELQFTLV